MCVWEGGDESSVTGRVRCGISVAGFIHVYIMTRTISDV